MKKLPADEKRSEPIQTSVKPKEAETIKKLAAKAGRKVGDYVYRILIGQEPPIKL